MIRFRSLPTYQNVDFFIQLVTPKRTLITLCRSDLTAKLNRNVSHKNIIDGQNDYKQFLKCNYYYFVFII
jgi:hypothetical protein